ncbi:MAG: DTW domain-containing protein [Candidatus Hermodarchaeota archaeon]
MFPENHIHIIVHPKENPRKCTVPLIRKHLPKAHYHYDIFSEELEFPAGTFLLYPDDDAQDIKSCKGQIRYICLLDGTWNQTKQLKRLERINQLPKVILNNVETQYLRGKNCPNKNLLATSEALHFFLLEMGWKNTPLIETMINAFNNRKGTMNLI